MRAADEYTINTIGIPSRTLMFSAGSHIAEAVKTVVKQKNFAKILIVCGTGNNGGDGFICGEVLRKFGLRVNIFAFEGKMSDDCQWAKSEYRGDYTEEINADLIVDCIFGTGLTREVTGKYSEIIAKINDSGAYVIAADIPSGINGDNGLVMGCAVKADLTVAVAEYKVGMFIGDGPDYCGEIIKKDIGIICNSTNCIVTYSDDDIKLFYPVRKRNSHKGTYGSANIVAGCDKYIGAAALASEAALKSGCGYLKLTTSDKVKLALAAKYPQVIFLEDPDLSSQAIAIGMGCGIGEKLYDTINSLLQDFGGKLIIDADGLNTLSRYGVDILKNKKCSVILTPHIKEFSRLTGKSVKEILNDPVTISQQFAENYGVTLLLKSASSIITDGRKTVINTRGSTALSKGGSGDMLSGYICGCAARGLGAFDAAVCGAYTMGLSAELSSKENTDYCATAKDILKNLHLAVRRLTKNN